ncbi:M48 family metallopeptidase [Arenicellales bacterium IMCC57338]
MNQRISSSTAYFLLPLVSVLAPSTGVAEQFYVKNTVFNACEQLPVFAAPSVESEVVGTLKFGESATVSSVHGKYQLPDSDPSSEASQRKRLGQNADGLLPGLFNRVEWAGLGARGYASANCLLTQDKFVGQNPAVAERKISQLLSARRARAGFSEEEEGDMTAMSGAAGKRKKSKPDQAAADSYLSSSLATFSLDNEIEFRRNGGLGEFKTKGPITHQNTTSQSNSLSNFASSSSGSGDSSSSSSSESSQGSGLAGLFGAAGKKKPTVESGSSSAAAAQSSSTNQSSSGDGVTGLFGSLVKNLEGFDQKAKAVVADQFPDSDGNGSTSGTKAVNPDEVGAALGSFLGALGAAATGSSQNAGSGSSGGASGLAGLFGAAGKKKTPSAGGSAASAAAVTSASSSSNQASGSAETPMSLEEFRRFVNFGPVDSFYLGRANLGDFAGDRFLPISDPRVAYLQSIVNSLARYTRVPFVYESYVVMVIQDDDSVNAFAAPGGFVITYTGMLNIFENEDELAYLMAHEMAHFELTHGVSAVVSGQSAAMFGTLFGGGKGTTFSQFVDGLYNFAKTGYGLQMETEADDRALLITQQAGYDPSVAPTVMEKLKSAIGHYGGAGYPKDRATRLLSQLERTPYLGSSDDFYKRVERFRSVLRR